MGAHRRDSPDSPHPFSLTQATWSARFRQGTLEADLAIATPAAEVAERGDLAYLRCPIDSNGGPLPFKKTGQGAAGPAPRPWQARGPWRPSSPDGCAATSSAAAGSSAAPWPAPGADRPERR